MMSDITNIRIQTSGGKDVFGECGLTYLELVNVYMEALVENIKEFLERNTYIV